MLEIHLKTNNQNILTYNSTCLSQNTKTLKQLCGKKIKKAKDINLPGLNKIYFKKNSKTKNQNQKRHGILLSNCKVFNVKSDYKIEVEQKTIDSSNLIDSQTKMSLGEKSFDTNIVNISSVFSSSINIETFENNSSCLKLTNENNDMDFEIEKNNLRLYHCINQIYSSTMITDYQNQRLMFLKIQNEINEKNRAILISWMLSLSLSVKLIYETFFLACRILDSYSCKAAIPINKYQLIGIGSLIIAMKFIEIRPPNISNLLILIKNQYSVKDVLEIENEILQVLDFKIPRDTIYNLFELLAKSQKIKKHIFNMSTVFLVSAIFDQRVFDFGIVSIIKGVVDLAQKVCKDKSDFCDNSSNKVLNKFLVHLIKNLEKASLVAVRKLYLAN